jgi:hypothetical protein
LNVKRIRKFISRNSIVAYLFASKLDVINASIEYHILHAQNSVTHSYMYIQVLWIRSYTVVARFRRSSVIADFIFCWFSIRAGGYIHAVAIGIGKGNDFKVGIALCNLFQPFRTGTTG